MEGGREGGREGRREGRTNQKVGREEGKEREGGREGGREGVPCFDGVLPRVDLLEDALVVLHPHLVVLLL